MAEVSRILFQRSPALKATERRAYTYLGLTLTALSVFGAFAVRPTVASIASLIQKKREMIKLEKSFDAKIEALAKAQENFGKVKEDLPIIRKSLPSQEAFPELLDSLSAVATKNDVKFTNLGFSKAKFSETEESLVVIPLRIGVEGNFWAVVATIREIEEGFQVIKIKEMTVSRGGEGEALSATLTAETYAFSPRETK